MAVKASYMLTTPAGTNEQTGVGEITATATGNSREYGELGSFSKGILFLTVSAASGTSPTLDVVLQVHNPFGGTHTDPSAGEWHTIATFPQQTAATGGTPIAFQTCDLLGLTYRLKWTIGGTTPSFTFSCGIVAHSEEAWP